jgi:hypothetical protein
MQLLDAFRLPIATFKFKDHDRYKELWSEDLKEADYLIDDVIKFTHPNLHKDDMYDPLTEFFRDSFTELINRSGMSFDFGITSMWGTHQTRGGKHNSHTHGNNMFAGVYYLNSDKPENSGTILENVVADLNPIKLERLGHSSFERNIPGPDNFTSWYHSRHYVPFEEGKLLIFPAWMRHQTPVYDGEIRQIIAFNIMPIGRSYTDPFDRYYYQDFADENMHGD